MTKHDAIAAPRRVGQRLDNNRVVPRWRLVSLPTALAMTLIVGLTGRRWWQMGEFPTGLDGGQWLALGRGLFGAGRDTAGAYAPLIPALAAAGDRLFGPSLALKLVGVVSFAAILLMVWLIARDGLGPWRGLAVLAIAGPASALTEPLAFGGYPQLLALAALLLAAWSVARYLADGGGQWLAGAAGGLAIAALAHHIYYPLALGVVGLVGVIWLVGRPPRTELVRRGAWAAGAVVLSGLLFLPTGRAFLDAAYAPPLAAAGLDRWAAWQYGTREAVTLWTGLAVLGAAGLVAAAPRAWRQPAWQVAAAMLLLAGGLLAATAEARLLPPVLIALAIGVGYALDWLAAWLPAGRAAALPVVIAVALPLLLVRGADGEATAFFRYYLVLDQSLFHTAAAIEAAAPTGLVAVRADARGWPVGWWLEGLTTAPIAVGSDSRWLGFPAERERAATVAALFAPGLSGEAAREQTVRAGIELIVIRQREWIGWQRWVGTLNPPFTILFDDGEHLVLRVRPPAATNE